MGRRTAGVVFIGIAAFLYGVKYLSAAIFGSNVSSWNGDLFERLLDYVGNGPIVWSVISLVIGIFYLIYAEFEDKRIASGSGRNQTGEEREGVVKTIKENWNRVD